MKKMKAYLLFGLAVAGVWYLIYGYTLIPGSPNYRHLVLTRSVAVVLSGTDDPRAALRKLQADPAPLGQLSDDDRRWLADCRILSGKPKASCVSADEKHIYPLSVKMPSP